MTIRYMTVVALLLGAGLAATAPASYAQSTATARGQAQGDASARLQMNRQAMMADMQAAQKRLDDLVAQMNAATGPDKIDRIAAVVTELAAMHKRMGMMMQGGMMRMPQGGRGGATQPSTPAGGADHLEHHTP
jgi:hypothetical protein